MPRRILRADQYQKPDDFVRTVARRHERQIAESVAQAFEDFQEQQTDDDAIARALAAGGTAGLIAALGFDQLRNDLRTGLGALDGLFREAAAEAARQSGLQPSTTGASAFPAIELPGASEAAPFYSDLARYRDNLIDDIVTSSEDGLAAAVQRAAGLNIPVDDLARAVRSAVGLTDRQAFAVFNYRRALEEGAASLGQDSVWALRDRRFDVTAARAARGEPVDPELVNRMVDAYARRHLAYRAQMIAETEASKVANAAVRANWVQAINNGVLTAGQIKRHWRVALDERTCPICYSVPLLNPIGVGMFEPFLSIEGPVFDVGLHPWCRCDLDYVVAPSVSAASAPREMAEAAE